MRAKVLKRCLSSLSQVFLGLDKRNAGKLTLKPTLGCFHDLNERQRMLALSWVVFTAWMRARGSSPFPELFSKPNESKRAKKTLELI
jgi:hypothetical protein